MSVSEQIAETAVVNATGWAYVFSTAKWNAYMDAPATVVSMTVAAVVITYTVLRIIHLVTHWRHHHNNRDR